MGGFRINLYYALYVILNLNRLKYDGPINTMNKNYNHNLENEVVSYTIFKNPIGLTGLAATKIGLVRIVNKVSSEKTFENDLVKNLGFQVKSDPRYFKDLIEQFQSYFKGDLKVFQFPLDLRLGTAFQQKVWKGLLTIPYGVTHSYKWLAKAINHPQSARAVGNANGQNPLSIVIPCHRVIRENGDLGGYTGGVDIKRYLLKLENSI